MRIPRQVKVGGQVYKVIQNYKFHQNVDLCGQADHSSLEIRLSSLDTTGKKLKDSKIEEVFIHKSYPKTVLIMGYVRGVILMSAGLNSIPVFNYPATTIKKFLTGSGRASKDQIQRIVKKRLNINNTLTPDDVSDAIAIALCHSSAVLNNI